MSKEAKELYLGPGITQDQLRAAIKKSGYPLQTVVGQLLRKCNASGRRFFVQEEWGYVDRDSKELRNIDLLATLRLEDFSSELRIRPALALIVECKQSDLPFIFFESPRRSFMPEFPQTAGLRSTNLLITTDDSKSTWHISVNHALGFDRDKFLASPSYCHTFSKCVRQGKDLSLSGSDAYNSLVLPLVKATDHFVRSHEPPDTAVYFDCFLVMACAVVDAPMVRAHVNANGTHLTDTSWVRVVRHEYEEEKERFDRDRLRVIDIVSKDFLTRYIEKHLAPFAARYAARASRHAVELASGKAFVEGMETHGYADIESRMKPKPLSDAATRAGMTLKAIKKARKDTED